MNQKEESVLPSNADVENIIAQNVRRNFPHYEIAIRFEGSETRFGPNFRKIAERVSSMPDSFGLCGVLAVTANGLLSNYSRWQDVDYNPNELKTMFDNWWKTRKDVSAWQWFDKTYKNRFREGPNDFAVLSADQLERIKPTMNGLKMRVFEASQWKDALKVQETNRSESDPRKKLDLVAVTTPTLSNIFDQLGVDEGIDIAVLCEYPIQKGTHTHWLSARKHVDKDKLLVVGDLKPFGIQAVGITVPLEDTLKAMDRVIGSSPTTSLTTALAESNKADRNLHNDKMFLMNFVRRKF